MEGQWQKTKERKYGRSDQHTRQNIGTFHFLRSPWGSEKLHNRNHCGNDHPGNTCNSKNSSEGLQSVGLQHLVQEHDDSKSYHPTVNRRGYGENTKQETVLRWKERVVLKFQTQAVFLKPTLQNFIGFLTKVGDLQQIHCDVISVKP